MNKNILLKNFDEFYIQSVSEFQCEDDCQRWASYVEPLIKMVSLPLLIEFQMASRSALKPGPDMRSMLQIFHTAYNELKLDIDLECEKQEIEYYSENSQFSIQKKISYFLNQSKYSICIFDAYMDDKIINELDEVEALNIKLLTNKPKKIFFQRLEAFIKEHPNLKIEVKKSERCHDRYYIIDKKRVMHSGGSYNDAGNKASNVHEMQNVEDVRKLTSDFESWWESAVTFKQDS